jgi:UDP-glucuronate 4-epimerase
LIGLIEEAIGKKAHLERRPSQPGDVSITYADITKARETLDYRPTVGMKEGIKRFVEWYQAQKKQ